MGRSHKRPLHGLRELKWWDKSCSKNARTGRAMVRRSSTECSVGTESSRRVACGCLSMGVSQVSPEGLQLVS